MGTASSAVAVNTATAKKLATREKLPEPPADLLNIVVMNPDFKEDHWGIYKSQCGPIRKVVNECKAKNPPPPRPYDAPTKSCPSYHIRGISNGRCGCAADHKPHTVDQDDPLEIWVAEDIPLPEGVTA